MIVLGFGGNLGTDAEIVDRFRVARFMLARLAPLLDQQAAMAAVRGAALYRTAPIGPAQPPFLNTAVAIALPLEPALLLSTVHEIEAHLGRVRDVRWGPRTIDLDILVWDDRVIHTPDLDVPHPRLHERRFALQPLVDLVGADFVIPNVGRAGDALARVADQALELIAPDW